MRKSLYATLARVSILIGILAISALPTLAMADSAPPEDRGWGTADFASDESRYQARVRFYEDRLAMLRGRRQQINAELNLFWRNWSPETRSDYIEQFDKSADGILRLGRVKDRKDDENSARNLFVDYQTNCSRCDVRKPENRERAYNFHLDYLRRQVKRMAEYNSYLDLRQQRIKANVGTSFEEWMVDNNSDFNAVVKRVVNAAADDLYKACIEGAILKTLSDAASLKLTGKKMAKPGKLLIDCVKDAGFGALANALLFTLQKQFIDDMTGRGIHAEVAEYWMYEILAPKAAGKIGNAGKIAQVTAKLLAREFKNQIKFQIRESIKTGLRWKFMDNPWAVANKPSSDAGLLKIRRQAINKIARKRQKEIIKNLKLQFDAYDAGTFLGKYIERVLPLVTSYYDFADLERLEVPKYWEIRRCLTAQGKARHGSAILAVLKSNPEDFKAFKRECRKNDQAACPAGIENAKTLIVEAGQTRSAISREAGDGRVKFIDVRIQSLENGLKALSDQINRVALDNANLCTTLQTEQQTLTDLLARVRGDANKTASLRDQARTHAGLACKAEDVPVAENEARAAKDAAEDSTRIGNAIEVAHAGLVRQFGKSSEIVDTDWAQAESAAIAGDIDELQSAAQAAAQKRDAAVARLAGGEAMIAVCTQQNDREVGNRLTEERQKLTSMTFGKPEQIARLRDGLRNAETWIGEMVAKQDASRACLKTLPDPAELIADVKSWGDAADLFIEAAVSDAARARNCVESVKTRQASGARPPAGGGSKTDIAAAKAALDACAFKTSRALISKLPEGPQRTALAALWNTAYGVEKEARRLIKAAEALMEQDKPGAAVAELLKARNLGPCKRTIAAINSAITGIQKKSAQAEASEATVVLDACRFKKSREMIGKLPQGPQRTALVASWNSAYETERRVRDLINVAVGLENQGAFGRAVGKLHEAGNLSRCDSTIAAIDAEVSRINSVIEYDRKAKAKAARTGCENYPGYRAGPVQSDGKTYCIPDQATANAKCRDKNAGSGWYASKILNNGSFECRQNKAGASAWCNSNYPGYRAGRRKRDGSYECIPGKTARNTQCERDFGYGWRAGKLNADGKTWECFGPKKRTTQGRPQPRSNCPPGHLPGDDGSCIDIGAIFEPLTGISKNRGGGGRRQPPRQGLEPCSMTVLGRGC